MLYETHIRYVPSYGSQMYNRGRRGHDHMVVWFTTSYAISAYHHWCFELESRSELLVKSKLPSLKIRRIRTIAIETFEIMNKETPQYLHDLVTLRNNKYNFRYMYSNTAHTMYTNSQDYPVWIELLDNMLQKLGMSCQTISGKKHLSINLRV